MNFPQMIQLCPENWISNSALTPKSFNHYFLILSILYLQCLTGKFFIETSLHKNFIHCLLVDGTQKQEVGNFSTRRQYLCCICNEVSAPEGIVEKVDVGRQYRCVQKHKRKSENLVCLVWKVCSTNCGRWRWRNLFIRLFVYLFIYEREMETSICCSTYLWGWRNVEGLFITGCHPKELWVLSEECEESLGSITRERVDEVLFEGHHSGSGNEYKRVSPVWGWQVRQLLQKPRWEMSGNNDRNDKGNEHWV